MHPLRMRRILQAGLLCGILDISAAILVYQVPGGPERLLQGIAFGLLGKETYTGGWTTALVGLACHFVIALSAAAVYSVASRHIRVLLTKPWVAGPLYGLAVYFWMQLVVLPLSRIGYRPLSVKGVLIGGTIHMLCVGLPIALVLSRRAYRSS